MYRTITIRFFVVASFLLAPFLVQAQSFNTGLIEGIWFSKDVYTLGENIRIYTAVQNNSGFDVTGEVHFFDNGESIAVEPFTVLNNRIVEVLTNTEAESEGVRTFMVSVEELKANNPENNETFVPSKRISRGDVLVIRDSDGDGVADGDDRDDDNDGFSDNAEKRQGSDPLDPESIPEITPAENILSLGDDAFEDDVSGEVPQAVEEFSNELPLVKPLVGLINNIQNEVIARAQEAQQQQKEETQKAWYYHTLPVINWIFSCFWCTALLFLGVIYLVIKLIMKVVRRF